MDKNDRVKIWMRLGVEFDATREEAEKLLQGCESTLAKMIGNAVDFDEHSRMRITGDSYIPAETLEDLWKAGEQELVKKSPSLGEYYSDRHLGFGKFEKEFSHHTFDTVEFGFL